jgi:uncharacterized protein
MNRKSHRELPPRLPIYLGPVSNGEYVPRRDPRVDAARRLAHERAAVHARRKGLSRRAFLESTCGAATVLATMNQVLGCGGGRYALAPEAELDEGAAADVLAGDEFIFDVQTHHVNPDRPWHEHNEPIPPFLLEQEASECGEDPWTRCFSRDRYLRDLFLGSDTHLAVLSALPGDAQGLPLFEDEAAHTRETVAQLEGSPRLRIHGIVLPNLHQREGTADRMSELVERWDIAAWKLYPQWGPGEKGYYLDDPELGLPVIQRAVDLNRPIIAIHKGLVLEGTDPAYSRPRDVGPVAKAFPNVAFLIYHSAYDPERSEGPYDPEADEGVDALIRSLQESNIPPNANVYAELGTTWHELMRKPDDAAHVLGKLLKYVGEDAILWGTDSIWYGSPQDQIMAFRAFEISPELQDKHGYPALTPERKAKILGLNGARVYGVHPDEARRAVAQDPLGRIRRTRGPIRDTRQVNGPRTRREVFRLVRAHGGLPG